MRNVKISPSILSADLGNLAGDLEKISNADFIHIDVMDGHFTPNLTFGPEVVRVAKRVSNVPLDVHMSRRCFESRNTCLPSREHHR